MNLLYIALMLAVVSWTAVEYLIKDATKRPTALVFIGALAAFIGGQYFHQTVEQCGFLFTAVQMGGNLDGLIQTIPGLSKLLKATKPASPPPSA